MQNQRAGLLNPQPWLHSPLSSGGESAASEFPEATAEALVATARRQRDDNDVTVLQAYRPRIHGLRHTFAVATLLGWYRAGDDVMAKVPLLSTYLGHAGPVATC